MKRLECDCVVLCGGQGQRLRPVVEDVPKVMAEVAGRPFLDIILHHLKSQGARRVILCTGYKADLIEAHYRQHPFEMTILFSREPKPLGTGGALKGAMGLISTDPFVVLNGDSFAPVDLRSFLDFHKSQNARASLTVTRACDTVDFGNLQVDPSGRIIQFLEKPSGNLKGLVNAGVYCFSRAVLTLMPARDVFSLERDFFPFILDGRVYAYRVDDAFIDIGTPERYASAKQYFKMKGTGIEDRH